MSKKSWWRRIAIAAAAVLVVVLVGGSITLFTISRRALPDATGDFRVEGLDGEVQVMRDDLGVPQIYATTAHDLFMAQGYVHAQDRFFEMDFRRHVTAGRLAELVGEAGLDTDRVIRTLGWRRVAEQEWQLLSPEARSYLQAYADGVNAYIGSRAPGQLGLEYTVLDMQVEVTDIEEWTPVDSLAWLKAMAWDLLGNYGEELGRAAIYGQAQGYGADVALDMVRTVFPPYPTEQNLPILTTPELLEAHAELEGTDGATTTTDGEASSEASTPDPTSSAALDALDGVAAALDAVPHLLGEGDGLGSNSWVVSGEHTESGLPLLANDPHLGITQPGIWYQNGLHCSTVGPDCPFEVAGFSFAGLPGVVIGHNAELGWGFTNMGSDAVDLFLERVYPDGTFLYDGAREPLTVRQEVIEVNGGEAATIEVASTGHGPIISDVLGDARAAADRPASEDRPPAGVSGFAVAMQWTALQPGRTAEAIFMLNTASDAGDVAAAAAVFEVPTQNIVFATTDGDIGYQAPGKIPVRADVPGAVVPADGSWPRPGWDPRYDWQGFVDAADMPHALNPDEGFIVAANQAVQAPGTEPFLTNDYDYGYRSQAIREAIEQRIAGGDALTAADMSEIQMIDLNPFAEMLVPALLRVPVKDPVTQEDDVFTEQAVDLLASWDLHNDADSAAAAYFSAVWANLLRLTFWDQIPESQRPSGGSQWLEAVAALLEDDESPWWDDRATLMVVEQRDQILAEALRAARSQLTVLLGKDPTEWRWAALHEAAPQHQVLGGEDIPGVIRNIVNPEPIGVAGGSSIVNANGWDAAAWEDVDGSPTYPVFTVTAVPSMRMVLDLSDWDASTWVQLTGNSGHPLSQHYSDQFASWASGDTFPWAFSAGAVEAATNDTLTLQPPG